MKRSLKIVGIVFGAISLTVAGYLFGRSNGYTQTVQQLQRETAGNLGLHVEMLARLRTGDVDGAAELLERSVDVAVATLPQGRAFSQEPSAVQNVFMAAKTYRGAYKTEDASANAVLKEVPALPLNHSYCSPALGKIAVLSGTRNGS